MYNIQKYDSEALIPAVSAHQRIMTKAMNIREIAKLWIVDQSV